MDAEVVGVVDAEQLVVVVDAVLVAADVEVVVVDVEVVVAVVVKNADRRLSLQRIVSSIFSSTA